MAWILATSIQRLIAEVNAAYPNRSKSSDGTIGDAAHSSRWEDSDHNPWLNNTVRACDITASGIPAQAIAERIRQLIVSGDPRMANGGYVIFNNRIASNKAGGAWRMYSGSNPHTAHMHVSVSLDSVGYMSSATWGISGGFIDLGELPAAGTPTDSTTNRYLTAVTGSTSVTGFSPAWQDGGDWDYACTSMVWNAGTWVGQRNVSALLGSQVSDPHVYEAGAPMSTLLNVVRYRYRGAPSSGYTVSYAIDATHSAYEAHWNLGIYLADISTAYYPRAGFRIESAWQLTEQIQVLDGSGSFTGQIFVPSNEFTIAILSDWTSHGDLAPDILEGEDRSRTATMTVLSIDPAPFGIAGSLSNYEGEAVGTFNGLGIPGTSDIEHLYTNPFTANGGECR